MKVAIFGYSTNSSSSVIVGPFLFLDSVQLLSSKIIFKPRFPLSLLMYHFQVERSTNIIFKKFVQIGLKHSIGNSRGKEHDLEKIAHYSGGKVVKNDVLP